MNRSFLSLCLGLALAGTALGDALVLKDGRKLSGRVVEKADGFEINVEGQTLGFAKEDVVRWVKSPKELTADADKLYSEAKDIYSKAVEIRDEKAAEAKMREALPKVTRAREAYAEARDLFPDGYADLDAQLVNVMKLMRLVRERLGSQIASAPPSAAATAVVKVKEAPPPKPAAVETTPVDPEPEAAPSTSMAEALAVVIDPVRRGDPAQRAAAKALFRRTAEERHPMSDVAMAGFLFLSRDDYGWGLVVDEVQVKGNLTGVFRGRLVKKSDVLQALVMADGRELRIRETPAGTLVAPPGGTEVKADAKVSPGLRSASYDALQTYFKGIDAEKFESLPEREIAEGVTFLALKVKELRGKNEPVDALSLFVAGPASALISKSKGTPSKELEAAFKDLAFEKPEYGTVWGTKPGLAMDDYRKWLSSGEYGLAIVQFHNDYRSVTEFPVKYALGLLHVFKALADNRAYNKAAAFLELTSRSAPTPGGREHLIALAKSIRSESPCMACAGTHQLNCTACKGKQKLTLQCGRCGGSGKINNLRGGVVKCVGCNGEGYFRNVDCPKCKASGKTDCKARDCDKPVKPPTFDTFADAFKCTLCKGQGSLMRHVAYPCPECSGVGLIIQPRSDPTKLLK